MMQLFPHVSEPWGRNPLELQSRFTWLIKIQIWSSTTWVPVVCVDYMTCPSIRKCIVILMNSDGYEWVSGGFVRGALLLFIFVIGFLLQHLSCVKLEVHVRH